MTATCPKQGVASGSKHSTRRRSILVPLIRQDGKKRISRVLLLVSTRAESCSEDSRWGPPPPGSPEGGGTVARGTPSTPGSGPCESLLQQASWCGMSQVRRKAVWMARKATELVAIK